MKSFNQPLFVHLNGHLAGYLTKSIRNELSFQYDHTWLNQEYASPISVSLPLQEENATGAKVTAVFENLLPDTDIDKKLLARNVRASGTDTFSILSAIGKDCVGAFQFLSENQSTKNKSDEMENLDESSVEEILKNLEKMPLGLRHTDNFRITIAGAQKKTALLFRNKKWWKPNSAARTTHILKPPIGFLGELDLTKSVENEFYCLNVLELFGLPVNEASIETFGETNVLTVKRFDRKLTKTGKLVRIHQEDLCQALSVNSNKKYQNEGGPRAIDILNLLSRSDRILNDTKIFVKSLVLFNLLGATDGHAKNYSIFLKNDGTFQLTPLYDVISLQPNIDSFQLNRKNFKMSLSVGNNRHYNVNDIVKRHYLETGERAGISAELISDAFDEITDSLKSVFEKVESVLPPDFPIEIHESIMNGAKKRARLLTD